MKDLIMILAYTPDDYREDILRNLVKSLNKFNNTFDVMVVSHTPIAVDIQKKVDIAIFDKKNDILTDWDLLNQPWFSPGNDRRIQSSFLSKKNTQLAIWRMLSIGFSTAKNLGYTKVHHIEYDCVIKDISEFIKNSELLETFSAVVYIKKEINVDDILFGSFQSYKIDHLNDLLLNYNEDRIKELIRNAEIKSPEKMLYDLILHSGVIYTKDKQVLDQNGNLFGIVDAQTQFNPWSIPFYDQLTHEVCFLVWNTKIHSGIKHVIVVNNKEVLATENTLLNHWQLLSIGNIENIESLIIIENEKIRDTFSLKTFEEKELFKKMSYRCQIAL